MAKKIKLLLLLFILSNITLYSQKTFLNYDSNKVRWDIETPYDSINFFLDKKQIIECIHFDSVGKFPFMKSEEFCINNQNIFMLLVDFCFGMPCQYVYIFKEKKEQWIFIKSLSFRFPGDVNIKIDADNEKIIFEGISSKLLTDTTNIKGKDIYEVETTRGKKKIFERVYTKIAELPFEVLLKPD